MGAISWMLAPAANAFSPAPASTTARTCPSRSISRKRSTRLRRTSVERTFTGGWSIQTTATESFFSVRTNE